MAALLIANLYYAQVLAAPIAAGVHVEPAFAGWFAAIVQIGYALGLFFIAPLGDMVENRKLVLRGVFVAAAAALLTGLSQSPLAFALAALVLGLAASTAQVILPYLTHLVPPERRGRSLGLVMATVLGAIALARPGALAIASLAGWSAVFFGSAIALLAVGLAAWSRLPERQPPAPAAYTVALAGTLRALGRSGALRRRALGQAALFGAFNMFWTSLPLVLQREFDLRPGVAASVTLVALAGMGVAPLVGHRLDRGARADLLAIWSAGAVTLALLISVIAVATRALPLLVLAALLLDAGLHTNQTTARLFVMSLNPGTLARSNSLYMTILFAGGAAGSVLGPLLLVASGWSMMAILAAGLAAVSVLGLTRVDGQAVTPAG